MVPQKVKGFRRTQLQKKSPKKNPFKIGVTSIVNRHVPRSTRWDRLQKDNKATQEGESSSHPPTDDPTSSEGDKEIMLESSRTQSCLSDHSVQNLSSRSASMQPSTQCAESNTIVDESSTCDDSCVQRAVKNLQSSPKKRNVTVAKLKCAESTQHSNVSGCFEHRVKPPAASIPHLVHCSPRKNWTVSVLSDAGSFRRNEAAPKEQAVRMKHPVGTQKPTVLDDGEFSAGRKPTSTSDGESNTLEDKRLSKDVAGANSDDVCDKCSTTNSEHELSDSSNGTSGDESERDTDYENDSEESNASDNNSSVNTEHVNESDNNSSNGMSDDGSEQEVDHESDSEENNGSNNSSSVNSEHVHDSDNNLSNGMSDDGSEQESQSGHHNDNILNGTHQDQGGKDLFDREYLQKRVACVTNVNVGESVLMAITLAERHSLSGAALNDMMQMCNVLLGKDALPATSYKLRKVFKEPLNSIVYHIYCEVCACEIGTKLRSEKDKVVLCPNCEEERCVTLSNGNFFVILNIKEQLKMILESEQVSYFQCMRETGAAASDSINALNQTSLYNDLCSNDVAGFNPSQDFTFNFNIDGATMFHTSKHSLYPIQMMINELPSVMRHDKIVLAGLWYGKGPVMEVFMEPFIAEVNKLSELGVKWVKTDGRESVSKFFPLCCCVDSVARPQIQNHSQFNAYSGCSLCLHPGYVAPGTKTVRYPYHLNGEIRTQEGIVNDMKNAFQTSKVQHGVKGPSPVLSFVPKFNVLWGFPPDYMHGALLGVADSLTNRLLSTTYARYYLGRPATIRRINARLQSITPPDIVNRLPESLDKRSLWHASDWKWWLLMYCIPCLSGILTEDFLNHLALFVEAVTLLLKTEICPQDIRRARGLLDKFVSRVENFYGLSAMTFNIHTLLHYADAVEMCGPLWITSSFPFESKMQMYRKKIGGSKGVAIQIVERVVRKEYLPALEKNLHPCSQDVSSFVAKSCTAKKRYKSSTMVGNCVLVGNGKARNLNQVEQDLLGVSHCYEYTTLIHDGVKYCSASAWSKRRRNDVVKLTIERYGFIEKICVVNVDGLRVIKILVKEIDCEPLKCGNIYLSHVMKCKAHDGTSVCIEAQEIVSPCVYMSFETGSYICSFPNTLEVQ